jgi:SAM-dependent methyltransferase
MSVDTARYLDMERAAYARLVRRSHFQDESFTSADRGEFVVGSYAQQERFDYERWLLGGLTIGLDARALEYGCGPGRMMLRLAPRFARVDGIDISPEVVEVARRRCEHLPGPPRLMVTDGESVPVDAASYELAYSVICLQHICVYAVRRRIFEGLFRALVPGGVLTFQMGYGPGHLARVGYFADYVEAHGTNGAVDVTVLHPTELAIDLCDIGFVSPSFALTPTGPGDTHAAWIFFRVVKPGTSAAIAGSERDWREAGFQGARLDAEELERARRRQNSRGLMKRSRDEAATIEALRRRIAELEQRLSDQV